MLKIEPLGLHWLNRDQPDQDLCAHGGVRVTRAGEVFLDTGRDSDALSTGALHLLRTLGADHTPEHPLDEQLIPCCGHFMVIDPETGDPVNVGCSNGQNWWVRHESSLVELVFPDGRVLQINQTEWGKAVVAFADAVAKFYTISALKQPLDEGDADWYDAFWREWNRRRASASYA